MAERFDRDRFAYELAQELGIDYARVPIGRAPGTGVRDVQEGVQRAMEVGPHGVPADDDGEAVEDGAASGLSTINRARATPTRSALDPSPTYEAQRDAQKVLEDEELDCD